MKARIDGARILLVEGYTDQVFLRAMLDSLGIGECGGRGAGPCIVEQFGGRTKLLDQIEARLSLRVLRDAAAIGILLDADTSAEATRRSLRDRMKRVTDLDLPRDGGWLQHPLGARIGFHVVPGSGPDDQGELETLVWRAVQVSPAHAAKVLCVESFLECMRKCAVDAKKADKARNGALLSVLHPEDPRLGPAARAKHFDFDSEPLAALRGFLSGFKCP
jgi:hypothetical protein